MLFEYWTKNQNIEYNHYWLEFHKWDKLEIETRGWYDGPYQYLRFWFFTIGRDLDMRKIDNSKK